MSTRSTLLTLSTSWRRRLSPTCTGTCTSAAGACPCLPCSCARALVRVWCVSLSALFVCARALVRVWCVSLSALFVRARVGASVARSGRAPRAHSRAGGGGLAGVRLSNCRAARSVYAKYYFALRGLNERKNFRRRCARARSMRAYGKSKCSSWRRPFGKCSRWMRAQVHDGRECGGAQCAAHRGRVKHAQESALLAELMSPQPPCAAHVTRTPTRDAPVVCARVRARCRERVPRGKLTLVSVLATPSRAPALAASSE